VNLLRATVIASATLLLGGGYLASQSAFFKGTTGPYADAIDTPIVALFSLGIFLVCAVLACMPQKEESE
jgi:hypothetical protein